MLAIFSALSTANTMGRSFVLAAPLKTPVFLNKHLDADGGEGQN
jgi:hypothetical protein